MSWLEPERLTEGKKDRMILHVAKKDGDFTIKRVEYVPIMNDDKNNTFSFCADGKTFFVMGNKGQCMVRERFFTPTASFIIALLIALLSANFAYTIQVTQVIMYKFTSADAGAFVISALGGIMIWMIIKDAIDLVIQIREDPDFNDVYLPLNSSGSLRTYMKEEQHPRFYPNMLKEVKRIEQTTPRRTTRETTPIIRERNKVQGNDLLLNA